MGHRSATTRPSAKIPHVWLVDETGHKVSTLDVTQKGKFSLVTGLSDQAWAAAASKLDLPFLRTVVIGAKGAEDAYHDWHRARETDEAGAILVRPDGYVAWRHRAAVWDDEQAFHLLEKQWREAAEREVRHVRDVLLGRCREHRRVCPVGDVVEVLYARHRGDLLRLGQLVEADRAQAQVPDQALLPQFGECLELGGERVRNRRAVVDPGEGPEIDHVEHIEPEPAELSCTCSRSD